jgi:hypothetical protein
VPPKCTICDHPQRGEIEAALVAGRSLRNVAQQFGVSHDALHRHRKGGHIAEALAKASEAADVTRGDDLLARVRGLEDRALRILDRAEAVGELRVALSAIREVRWILKLLFDSQRKRHMDEEQTIGIDELMALMAAITDVILRHVADPKTRRAIADEVRCLTPPNPDPS